MDNEWQSDDLVEFLAKCLASAGSFKQSFRLFSKLLHSLPLLLLNMQTKSRSKHNVSSHYDIGNDLYQLMLDRTMNYSCGYWQKNAALAGCCEATSRLCETLEEAQINKMLLIAKKLDLKPGMRVLDIGCGWGELFCWSAELV